jgi:hypothetical protein
VSTTETSVGVLTREDVSYLRRASDVYVINIDGQNYLRVVKRRDFRDEFSEDKRVDIPVNGNGANGWFTHAHDFPWRTLRAGDEVRLYWYPDANTNELLRKVGLHADAVYVDVRRGKTWNRYLVDVSVCSDNSARACRTETPTSFG